MSDIQSKWKVDRAEEMMQISGFRRDQMTEAQWDALFKQAIRLVEQGYGARSGAGVLHAILGANPVR